MKVMEWLHIIGVIHLVTFAASFPMQNSLMTQNALHPMSSDDTTSNLCLTPGCVKAASDVLANLDENADPCQDFYRFACGGWLDSHTISDDRSSVDIDTELYDDLNLKLKILLESESDGTEAPFIKMTKDLYGSCMDLESIERAGSDPLKKALKKLGGWPVIEGNKWDESKFDWVETLIAFRNMGYNQYILLSVSVGTDMRNSTVRTLNLDEGSLGMPDRSYFLHGLSDATTAAYYEMMVKSAKLLGANEATVKKELLKVLHFETALANYSLPNEEKRDFNKFYNKYTVKQLVEEVPQIPWLRYINGMVNNEIYENETVIVTVPEFVKNVADLITKTEKRVVANYMLWRVVKGSMPLLSKKWRDIAHDYNSVSTGVSQESPRWEQCLSSVSGGLDFALSSHYVRHYFKEESKDAALELVQYIQEEFLRILDEIDWMDEQTKREAKAKAQAMTPHIGYPEELLNDTIVAKFYENLTITPESYLENQLRIAKWSDDYMLSKLRKPIIKEEWTEYGDAAVVNAFYDPLENTIIFPAAILQGAYFDKDRPNYLNFGGIGSVIGHEITHGFDDSGRQFDKDGNVVNWWDETTDKLFTEKAQCIIDQYSNYTAENGMNVNGVTTQGENIADNGGLKEAYWAYRSWVKKNGEEPLLPGVNYNQNQLFFLSFAHVWCGKDRPESLRLQILTDPHSPTEFRINGPLSNLEEFAEDFNCSPDSPMNKKLKCKVW